MPESTPLLYQSARHPASRFTEVDLTDTVFTDVCLRRAVFDDVALTGVVFKNVCLGGASIEDANLEGMRINGVLVTELFSAYSKLTASP
jgi:uncharacterized protein YjbI with pentapeptide repeats